MSHRPERPRRSSSAQICASCVGNMPRNWSVARQISYLLLGNIFGTKIEDQIKLTLRALWNFNLKMGHIKKWENVA